MALRRHVLLRIIKTEEMDARENTEDSKRRGVTMSRKLAVFFPGIGYTVDKPLLYYSRKLAASAGYEIRLLPYTGFPDKILGDKSRMQESYRIAFQQTEEMLSDVDISAYDDLLFVGKSIGTAVATEYAAQLQKQVRFVLYTPLEETFQFPIGDAIVFSGLDDPWVGKENSRIEALCIENDIPCTLIPSGNHSLETGNVQVDLANLQMIMKKTEEFVKMDSSL